ncbi:restriction endonuclease subunit S [Escherichia coli]|uniref:Type I restriction-modification enzyme, S subunit n=4 Tax=Escherichia coli TaxID=562 RepID=A0AAP8VVK5_ECOLX|nr:restriction endonuclease subunit S [Escherichia coli]ELP2910502.1 restriction endonuclease subunit S [Escherichia coli O128]HDQ6531107.1 restriction endonuclease subunit S [Escherichia coli O75:H8]HDQ6873525.1 restriction endonuclease subunit S [Escherichia coli O166:H28]HDQ6950558.1 restriction endonuclease subunit S [Escherichia coli Ou:H8]EEC8671873.1 restriction endonuclease subunit S [Escherichia coli]
MVDLMVNEQRSGTAGKDVPAGYKLTEVGVIPEDWVVISIDDCTTKVGSGKTPTGGASVYIDSGRPFVRSQNVDWGRLDLADVVHITDETHNTFSGSEIQQDDVLLNITGASIGRCAKADFRVIGGNVNQHVCIIRTEAKKLSPSLLVELINSNYGQNQIDSYQAGGNREGLNFSQVKNLKFAITPNSFEQTEIVRTLNDINAFTLALENLIAKKQAIKAAAMQQLLTGKTRLPQFALRKDGSAKGYKKSELGAIPEDWVVTSIGQFTDCCAGGTPSTKISAYWGGTHPWMSSGELHLKQVYAVADYITDEGLVNSSTKYVPKNSVLVGLAGQGKTRGTVAINRIELCTNQSIAAIFPSKHHSTEFLFYNLDSRYEELRSLSTGDGGRGGLNLTIIRKLHLAFPPKEEQTAIATILSDMDKEIQTLQQRLDKTRQLKQGMMQELLTGKTRLI